MYMYVIYVRLLYVDNKIPMHRVRDFADCMDCKFSDAINGEKSINTRGFFVWGFV